MWFLIVRLRTVHWIGVILLVLNGHFLTHEMISAMVQYIVAGVVVFHDWDERNWFRYLRRTVGAEPKYIDQVAKKIAAGDLTVTIETKPDDTTSLLFSIRQMTLKLSEIILEVRQSSGALSSSSASISRAAQLLSDSATT